MRTPSEQIEIVELNARGEGVAADHRAYGLALPGEHPGEPTSPERAEPICKYFDNCGGCAAQHMAPALYERWKRGLVVDALDHAGVKADVGALIDAHGEGRRRATFHARFVAGVFQPLADEVGFMRARSHEIVEIDDCPLFAPGLARALEAARAIAHDLRGLGKPLDIQATATLAGLDIDVRGMGETPKSETLKLTATAEAFDLARLSNHGRVIVERRPPEIAFGPARVVPPAGGFLQATQRGEDEMARLASAAIGPARRLADLFCGAGAFALRLGVGRDVLAIDSDRDAIAALLRARAPGLERVRAETRDLFQRPLRAEEFDGFDAVLFDPPRSGALAQAKEIAKTTVATVVAISCNALTFARDARTLIDGGYSLESVTPLDQFRYSPHVEIVAAFRRKPAAKRRRSLLG